VNLLDLVFGVTLLVSVYSGLAKGFARIGIGMAALLLAFLLATIYYPEAGRPLREYTSSTGVAHFLGFTAIFSGVIVAGALIGHAVTRFFKMVGLSWLNRGLGGAVGLVRGVLMSVILLMAANAFLPGEPPTLVVQSRLAPYLLDSSRILSNIMPADFKLEFLKNFEKVKKAWFHPLRDQFRRLE
jgi:membrane protein required for colicin V production